MTENLVEHSGSAGQRQRTRSFAFVLICAGLLFPLEQIIVFNTTPGAGPEPSTFTMVLWVVAGISVLAGLALLMRLEPRPQSNRNQKLLGVITGILAPFWVVAPFAFVTQLWLIFWLYAPSAIITGLILSRVKWRWFGLSFAITTLLVYLMVILLGPL